MSLKEVQSTACTLIMILDSTSTPQRWGSGVVLWDYDDTTQCLLLTARHVVEGGKWLLPAHITPEGDVLEITEAPVHIQDSLGNPTYLTYQNIDMAVIEIPRSLLKKENTKRTLLLPQSRITYSSDISNGDQVLILGSALNRKFLRHGGGKQFLATSGTIALHTDSTYIIDQAAFHGMSGGLVFLRVPAIANIDGRQSIVYGYSAVGIVVNKIPAISDSYSQAVKLDYIDSILIVNRGRAWGQPDTTSGIDQ